MMDNPDVTAMLMEGLNAESDEKQFGPPESWRFSDLGKCNRMQMMKRLGFHGPGFSAKTKFIFEMGHAIEQMALNWLRKVKRVDILATQVRVEASQFDARGSADALGRFGNQVAPIEVKSTRDKALEYRIPYETHKRQAGAYAWFLGLPRAVLAYIGRDGTLAHVWVEVTQELKEDIANQWMELGKYWALDFPSRMPNESDESYYNSIQSYLPPKIPPKEKTYKRSGPWGKAGTTVIDIDPECGYCGFKKLCWGSKVEVRVPVEEVGEGTDAEAAEVPGTVGREGGEGSN